MNTRVWQLLTVLLVTAFVAGRTMLIAGTASDETLRGLLLSRLGARADIGIVVGVHTPGGDRIVTAGSGGPSVAPLDGDTIFEIGSATKLFTAAALADMAVRGQVHLDDPIQAYLPKGVRSPTHDGVQIKLVDLATHTSGLPRLPGNLEPSNSADPYADYTSRQLYDFLSSYELPRVIGERYEYSNLGFGLLGHILALKSGDGYAAMVAERVLRPLHMGDTFVDLAPALRMRTATGHGSEGIAVPGWTFAVMAGAGALHSTARDLLKFVAANLSPSSDELGSALRMMQEPRHSTGTPDGHVGLAWHIRQAFDEDFIWHNGGTGGFHSFVGFNRRSGLGVVVLCNASDSIDDIGFHVLDERFPLAAAKPLPTRRVPVQLPAEALEAYVGTYEMAPGLSIVVTREGAALFIQPTGQARVQVFAESPAEFFLTVVDAQISFAIDGKGSVTGLVLHQAGRDMPGRKVK